MSKSLLERFTALFEQEPGEAVPTEAPTEPAQEKPEAQKKPIGCTPKADSGVYFACSDPNKDMTVEPKEKYYELQAPFLVGVNPMNEAFSTIILKAVQAEEAAAKAENRAPKPPDVTEFKDAIEKAYSNMARTFVAGAMQTVASFNARSDKDAYSVKQELSTAESEAGGTKITQTEMPSFKKTVLSNYGAAVHSFDALVAELNKDENANEITKMTAKIKSAKSQFKEINLPNLANVGTNVYNFIVALTILAAHPEAKRINQQLLQATDVDVEASKEGVSALHTAIVQYMEAVGKSGLNGGEIDNWLKARKAGGGAAPQTSQKNMFLTNVKWQENTWIRDILDAADEPAPIGGIKRNWEHALTKYNAYALKESGANIPIMELGDFGQVSSAKAQLDAAIEALSLYFQSQEVETVIPALPSMPGTLFVRMDKVFADTPTGKEQSILKSQLAQDIEQSIRTDVKRIFKHEESSLHENANESEPKSAEITDGREHDLVEYLTFMKDSLVPFINKETPVSVGGEETKGQDYSAVLTDMVSALSLLGAEKAGEIGENVEPTNVQSLVSSMLPDNGVIVFSPEPKNSDSPQLWIMVRDGWGTHIRGLYLVNNVWQMGAPFVAKRPVRNPTTAMQAMMSQGAATPLYMLPFRYIDRRSVLLTT